MTPSRNSDSEFAALEAHVARVMRNEVRVAGITEGFGDISRWERFVEALRWRGNPLFERWECWDPVQGRWRRYWRRNGSLPGWAAP